MGGGICEQDGRRIRRYRQHPTFDDRFCLNHAIASARDWDGAPGRILRNTAQVTRRRDEQSGSHHAVKGLLHQIPATVP